MSAWSLVEGLKLDLSNMSDDSIDTVIKNLDSGDINKILADLEEQREKLSNTNKAIELAFRIVSIVLSKGISLA